MILRKLNEHDIPGLALIYKQFWNEESSIDKMVSLYKKLMLDENYIILCAVSENRLVGSIQGIICYELYGDCKPFLVVENMIVDKEHRRKGVGKLLFNELEDYARQNECYQILLITERDRNDACGFYENVGFSKGKHAGFKKPLK